MNVFNSFGPAYFIYAWICGGWDLALVCVPVQFIRDRCYSARVNEITLFIPVFSITLCRNEHKINKNVCNEQTPSPELAEQLYYAKREDIGSLLLFV